MQRGDDERKISRDGEVHRDSRVNMTAKESKRLLRREMRFKRRAWRGAARARAELKLCEFIMNHPSVRRAQWIACYRAFDGEVDLSGLWGGGEPICPSAGKPTQGKYPSSSPLYPLRARLVFPRHTPHAPLHFVRPERWTKVEGSTLRLPEGESIPTDKIGVVLAPGVAFCPERGLRLGLGGGHYDRTLAQNEELSWSVEAFGVGFSFQICADLPVEPWDVALSGVFTELGIQRTSRGDI